MGREGGRRSADPSHHGRQLFFHNITSTQHVGMAGAEVCLSKPNIPDLNDSKVFVFKKTKG